ncbi:MAG TPA: T9SS type A sorting domain-containing protein, partial [Chryseosolibacter sp.]|nr:T9SS type A sorting domain-containing protein [Chryseosolibacter sp.]
HPAGDVMKVSTFNAAANNAQPITFGLCNNPLRTSVSPANTHWTATINSGGLLGGSSGGPLLDQNGRVVGQLHGGVIGCAPTQSHSGRFDVSWDGGGTAQTQLSAWLSNDPNVMQVDPLDIPQIAGPELVCTSNTYSVAGAPAGSSVTWTSGDVSKLTINSSTGLASRVNNSDGSVTLTASILSPGTCNPGTITKTIWVGSPYAGLGLDGSTLCCDYWRYVEPGVHTLTVFRYGKTSTGANTNVNIKRTRRMGGTTYTPTYYNSTANIVDHTWAIVHYGETYYFEITTSNTCGTWQGYATVTTDQNSPPIVSAYPNPANSELTVKLKDDGQLRNVVLFDSNQQIVYSADTREKSIIIQTKNFRDDTYILRVTGLDESRTEHVVIKH